MTDFLKVARALEMVREDQKWYANVRAVADALVEADRLAYERGVNDGLTGKRERAVPILDDYAPPVGPVAVCNEDTAQASAVSVTRSIKGLCGRHDLFYTADTCPHCDMDVAPCLVVAKPLLDLWSDLGSIRPAEYPLLLSRVAAPGAISRDYFPSAAIPQPDGDGRFPEEAE